MSAIVEQVGKFLEGQVRIGSPITYGRVLEEFPELPPLTGAWLSHPLCDVFGQLDAQDFATGRPFRTAFVYARETSLPGQGFFDMMANYRKRKIGKGQQLELWMAEVDALKAYYGN